MMADMFQMPVRTVANREGPALGAAILAGVACGVYEDIPSACENVIRLNEAQQPDPERGAQYERYYRLYEKTLSRHEGKFCRAFPDWIDLPFATHKKRREKP